MGALLDERDVRLDQPGRFAQRRDSGPLHCLRRRRSARPRRRGWYPSRSNSGGSAPLRAAWSEWSLRLGRSAGAAGVVSGAAGGRRWSSARRLEWRLGNPGGCSDLRCFGWRAARLLGAGPMGFRPFSGLWRRRLRSGGRVPRGGLGRRLAGSFVATHFAVVQFERDTFRRRLTAGSDRAQPPAIRERLCGGHCPQQPGRYALNIPTVRAFLRPRSPRKFQVPPHATPVCRHRLVVSCTLPCRHPRFGVAWYGNGLGVSRCRGGGT